MNPPDLERAWRMPPGDWSAVETLLFCLAAGGTACLVMWLWEKWRGPRG